MRLWWNSASIVIVIVMKKVWAWILHLRFKFHFQSGLADVPLEDRIGCCVDSLSLDSSGFLAEAASHLLSRTAACGMLLELDAKCSWRHALQKALPKRRRPPPPPLQKNKNVRKKCSEVHRNVKYLPLCASGWPWCEFYSISAQSLFSLTMESWLFKVFLGGIYVTFAPDGNVALLS